MQLNFSRVLELNGQLNELYKDPSFVNTKFGYATKKFVSKNFTKVFDEYNEELEGVRIENALTDEKTKELLLDEKGQYKFSKEGTFAVLKGRKEIDAKWREKEIEIEPYFCTDLPELTEAQKEVFKGVFFE